MKDATLGGYLREHGRPPAFEGCDGESYTVELFVEAQAGETGPWRAYLLFLSWREGEPVGHVESDYLVEGATEKAAREEIERMTLQDVKDLLDGLISR